MLKTNLLKVIDEVNKDKKVKWNVNISDDGTEVIIANNYFMEGMVFKILIKKTESISKIYTYDMLDDEYPINVGLVYNTVVNEEIEYRTKFIVRYFYRMYY